MIVHRFLYTHGISNDMKNDYYKYVNCFNTSHINQDPILFVLIFLHFQYSYFEIMLVFNWEQWVCSARFISFSGKYHLCRNPNTWKMSLFPLHMTYLFKTWHKFKYIHFLFSRILDQIQITQWFSHFHHYSDIWIFYFLGFCIGSFCHMRSRCENNIPID